MRTAKDFYSYGNGRIKMSLDNRTNGLVAEALYSAYRSGARVRIWYGDTKTGRAWLEELDVTGRVAVSMGPRHVPILLHSSRSNGGGAILDHCIVKIITTQGKRVLYEHPTFTPGNFRIGGTVADLPEGYTTSVHHRFEFTEGTDWQNVANFRTWAAAVRYVDFMTGKRMTTGGR